MSRSSIEAMLQREWAQPSTWQLVLRPLSWLFSAAVALRHALHRVGWCKGARLDVPVVAIGGVEVGGSGKTPLVVALVQALVQRGMHPGVVSRGYGRETQGVRHVAVDSRASEVGDEPLLIASRTGAPVCVGEARAAAARALLAAHPEVDVVICDDALQHLALARDVEIAVVSRPLAHAHLLPAGPFREPVTRLRRVDAIVTRDHDSALVPAGPARFTLQLVASHVVYLASGRRELPAQFMARCKGKRVAAVAGIAHPPRFFELVAALGIQAAAHAFADHHAYTRDELQAIEAELIIATEKDAVKLREFGDERVHALVVDAQIEPDLAAFVVERLARIKPA